MSISYPVDVANTTWTIWSISGDVALKHNKRWPRADGGEIVGRDPDLVPLLEVRESKPTYDAAKDKLVPADLVVDVDNNTCTHGWDVVPLIQEELDAIAEREANSAEDDVWKARYQLFNQGNATNTQMQKAIAHLIKKEYGNA